MRSNRKNEEAVTRAPSFCQIPCAEQKRNLSVEGCNQKLWRNFGIRISKRITPYRMPKRLWHMKKGEVG